MRFGAPDRGDCGGRNSLMEKKRALLIAPALTAAVMLSVYAVCGLYPFGTGTVAWCDMKQQVIPFLLDFRNIMNGKADMFLNLENAGGMNFWGVFLFFISSPFTFLVLLVPAKSIYLFVNILLVLKMMTCSLTAGIWMRRKYRSLGVLQTAAICVMYAFSGYTMFYYQNIVWLDVMFLFPLLLIGLELLAEEGRPLCYTLVFSALLVVNFYLSYMVVVFLILGAGTYLLLCVPKEERGEKLVPFGLATALSALLTGVVWLPSLLQYLSSARTGNLLSSLRSGSLFTQLDTTLPVLLCTTAAAAGAIVVPSLPIRRSPMVRWTGLMLALTVIPVFLEPVNKMWQTGSYQSFPVRYGYIPIFLGLILFAGCVSAVSGGRHLDSPSGRLPLAIGIASVLAPVFCAYSILKYSYQDVSVYTHTLWGDTTSLRILLTFAAVAMIVYVILLIERKYRGISRKAFSVLLCAAALTEAVFSASVYIASANNDARSYDPVLDLSDRIPDDSLYRVKLNQKYFDVNLLGSIGYNSMSHYTSLTAKRYMFGMKKLGYSSYWMEVGSNGGTKLTDALLANKYSVFLSNQVPEDLTSVYSNGQFDLAKNEITMPFGFVMQSDSIADLADLPDGTRFQTQEYLFQNLFSSKDRLFVTYQPTSLENVQLTRTDRYELTVSDSNQIGTVVYSIPVTGTQTLYFDCFDQLTNKLYEHINSTFTVAVNGNALELSYPSQEDNGLVCLGTFTDCTVQVHIGVLRNAYAKSFGIAGLRDDALKSAVSQAKTASLTRSANTLRGTVSADTDNSYLFLPISYADGFTARVNGKAAQVSRVFDTFLAVRLEKGENSVEVAYLPSGFRAGCILSAAGLLLLVLWLTARKRGAKPLGGAVLQKIFSVLFAVLFFGTIFAVYLFPLGIYLLT